MIETIQNAILASCFAGLGIIAVILFVRFYRAFLRAHRGRLDGLGKVVAVVGTVLATLYGGSKGFWFSVRNYGGDEELEIIGVYTAISNEVVEVSGNITTNQIPMVRIESFGAGLATETPVWIRMSDTNKWTLVEKSSPIFKTEGDTNVVEFVSADNYKNYTYWFVGNDKPAVVRPISGITVTGYHADGNGVTFEFTCNDDRCTDFEIKWKLATESDHEFRTVATGTASPIHVPGFWLDKTIDWRITSQFLEDGE